MKTKTSFTQEISKDVSFDMVWVEGGEFMMGGEGNDAYSSEKPLHNVKISGFYMGKFTITQKIWEELMGSNPSLFKGKKYPVESVSWEEVQDFLKTLNGITGRNYRLPSEAEWEYAAKGGMANEGYVFSGSDKLKEVGWYRENSDRKIHAVGQKMPNELGLYDMSGNVWEWMEDHWHEDYEGAPDNGSVWLNEERVFRPNRLLRTWNWIRENILRQQLVDYGAYRVLRGGSWAAGARDCRVSFRTRFEPGFRFTLGFRLALSPD